MGQAGPSEHTFATCLSGAGCSPARRRRRRRHRRSASKSDKSARVGQICVGCRQRGPGPNAVLPLLLDVIVSLGPAIRRGRRESRAHIRVYQTNWIALAGLFQLRRRRARSESIWAPASAAAKPGRRISAARRAGTGRGPALAPACDWPPDSQTNFALGPNHRRPERPARRAPANWASASKTGGAGIPSRRGGGRRDGPRFGPLARPLGAARLRNALVCACVCVFALGANLGEYSFVLVGGQAGWR
jgi:hypothetical protein